MGEGVTVFGIVALAMYSLIGTEFVTPLTGAARHPVRDVPRAMFVGLGAKLLFAAVAITATASLLNTVLGAVPRMLMEMAHAGEAFPVLARTNRHGMPWAATLFVAALPLVGLAWAGGDVGRIVPLPQVLAIGGMGVVILHAAPAPELEGPVFEALAAVLGGVGLIGALWVRLVMRRLLFEPAGRD
jgi:amino acid permease